MSTNNLLKELQNKNAKVVKIFEKLIRLKYDIALDMYVKDKNNDFLKIIDKLTEITNDVLDI